MTIDTITSSIGSALLFQSLRQNLDDYHQGAHKVGRIIYQCALTKITSASLATAMESVQWLSESSKVFLQENLVSSLAIPIILNLGDLFHLPIIDAYRKEIFAINSHFSTVCYTIMNIAIATFCLGSGWTLGVITLATLHVEPIIERLGLPPTLSSILSLSNKLIGNLYGLYSGNCIVRGITFFQTIRNIERLSLLYLQNKEAQKDALITLQNIPKEAAIDLSAEKVKLARYHLVRHDIIEVPPLPSRELPTLSDMLIEIDWENNSRAKQILINRLKADSSWCDQWGSVIDMETDIPKAIDHLQKGGENFAEYIATCPKPIRDRAMWILVHLESKTCEERIPYLIELALQMHYCIAGKSSEIEATYGILFPQIDNTSIASKVHQIMQYKREDLFKHICQEEVEKIYEILREKIGSTEGDMKKYERQSSDTFQERIAKCLYYIDAYFFHKIWTFRSMIVEKFKEKYINDVHIYNELEKELTNAIKQQKMPSGFLLTRLIHWLVIKVHEWILSPEVMSIRKEIFHRVCREYNTDFILRQLQNNLQNRDVLHPIDHQEILDWLQCDLSLEDASIIYEEDPTQIPTNHKIKESYLIYLLVRIGLLEISSECATDYASV